MKVLNYYPEDINLFKEQALQWATSFEVASYFDSNGYSDPYTSFDVMITAGSVAELTAEAGSAFQQLKELLKEHKTFIAGFLSYDLKNELENLHSNNRDRLEFDDLFFFIPLHVLLIQGNKVSLYTREEDIFSHINSQIIRSGNVSFHAAVKSRFSRHEYIAAVGLIQEHIARGDIYEMNFCQEFYAEDVQIDPVQVFKTLNKTSPAPFASFLKYNQKYLMSASPERFLCRKDNKVISQPIKGTAPRSSDAGEDIQRMKELRTDEKEVAENVMIVDLVRNDLTKCALPGSVKVEELFGIYSFPQVHQMISTVSCRVSSDANNADILAAAFPMGSMTGAPKVRAMEIIEKYERTKRGLFSGAVGYFAPNGDFDFNVVIRSLIYNAENLYLSFQTGSAITFASDPAREYDECLLKAKAIFTTLDKELTE